MLTAGETGGGGEYHPQTGFGWTNGVVLELLNQWGDTVSYNEYETQSNGMVTRKIFLCGTILKLFLSS